MLTLQAHSSGGEGEYGGGIEDKVDYHKITVLSIIIVFTLLGNLAVVFSILLRRAKVRNVCKFVSPSSVAVSSHHIRTYVKHIEIVFTL